MDLYIIRHAWAGQYGDPEWPDDTQRPLTEKGRKRFAALVGILSRRGMTPSLIATSPIVRCRETAQILAQNLIDRPEVIQRQELLPHGDLESLLAWSAQQAEKHRQIAWVGHAPDVGQLTAALIGQPNASIRFAKGAVAALRFSGPVEIGGGELRWLVTAKIIGAREDECQSTNVQ
ncbi:MAG: histidine phosphatase family protein [Thermoguttaceae bacterium]|jgi:phosphohistidine phosphatase